jgi:hypothetical protein
VELFDDFAGGAAEMGRRVRWRELRRQRVDRRLTRQAMAALVSAGCLIGVYTPWPEPSYPESASVGRSSCDAAR